MIFCSTFLSLMSLIRRLDLTKDSGCLMVSVFDVSDAEDDKDAGGGEKDWDVRGWTGVNEEDGCGCRDHT